MLRTGSIIKFIHNMNPEIQLFPKQREILKKFYENEYRELVVVSGRRGGKNFLGALLSVYEAYCILQNTLGDPFKYYRLAQGNPIYILNISSSSDQSKIAFNEIKHHIQSFKFFRDKVGKIEHNKIHLLTGSDKIQNDLYRQQGNEQCITNGSVVLECASANSETLRGKRIFTLLLNDLAFYRNDHEIYHALTPATADFQNPDTHELDSKIMVLSSPRCEGDILHQLYMDSIQAECLRYAVQYPTWEINPSITYEQLKKQYHMPDEDFKVEFGAQFTKSPNQTVSLRLPESMIETLKQIARQEAFESNRDVSYTDIIREGISMLVHWHRQVEKEEGEEED